jgi:hypothetical protein
LAFATIAWSGGTQKKRREALKNPAQLDEFSFYQAPLVATPGVLFLRLNFRIPFWGSARES